ncbi:MAG: hypothetical protein HY292_26535 [Planctomycetes bacterium]|nr:hypothetical protein [Planctomycetota bacterium]
MAEKVNHNVHGDVASEIVSADRIVEASSMAVGVDRVLTESREDEDVPLSPTQTALKDFRAEGNLRPDRSGSGLGEFSLTVHDPSRSPPPATRGRTMPDSASISFDTNLGT